MITVIIAAAGGSSRMGGINKQFSVLHGMPVIAHSCLKFEDLDEVFEIIVSARRDDIESIEKIRDKYSMKKIAAITEGGGTRQESVFRAFSKASKETRYIAVHDGARPLVSTAAIRQCIKDASIFGGAVLGVPVKDTLKVVDDGIIIDTPDRRKLYMIQTPQIFRRDIYVKGINFANEHGLDFTDDCQLAEAIGAKIHVTKSDYKNIKITTPEDLAIAGAVGS